MTPRPSYAAHLRRQARDRVIASVLQSAATLLLILFAAGAALQMGRLAIGAAMGVPLVLEQARHQW